ncbi:MAG: GMC family oxidoreductase [Acidobacteriia bacterium]|nr:GMC family oxidoreductase [Terriglobia bacterium]
MRQTYDAVVIGSGFGGAITACRLAQAGQTVCLLERGPRRQKTDFPRSPYDVTSRALWDEHRRQGFIGYRSFPGMDVIQGCGVGGGSLHYFNVCKQPPAAIFDQPRWPGTITLQRLEPYYLLARRMLDAKPLDPPTGRILPLRTQVFLDAVKNYHPEAGLVDIAVYRDDAGRGSQGACIYCGSCLFGCQVHAKNTLDLNYIRTAESHGTEVFPLHRAEYIEPHGRGYKVSIVRSRPAPGQGTDTLAVAAGKVIVAAGTLGSNELLLKCRDLYKTLPDLSPALGKGFSGNGDFLLAGTLYPDKMVDPSSGPSITAAVSFAAGQQQICIEDLGFPDPLLWYINGSVPTWQRFRQALVFAWHYLRSSLGLTHQSRMDLEIARLFRGGVTTGFLPYLAMGTDAADGVITLDAANSATVNWSHRASMPMFRQIEQHLREISRASGGTYVQSFLWAWPFRKLLTAHPLGGCALSTNPSDGVVNELGEVWNYPNLYVADGSVIPTALSVNPSATISAVAERIAFHMIHGREIEPTDIRSTASAAGPASG